MGFYSEYKMLMLKHKCLCVCACWTIQICVGFCACIHTCRFSDMCACVPPENVTVLSMCTQNLGDLSAVAYMLRSL